MGRNRYCVPTELARISLNCCARRAKTELGAEGIEALANTRVIIRPAGKMAGEAYVDSYKVSKGFGWCGQNNNMGCMRGKGGAAAQLQGADGRFHGSPHRSGRATTPPHPAPPH